LHGHGWFTCRISKVNGGIWFEKQGTQRMAGYLYPEDGMWVSLGAQSAKGEPLHRYFGNGASVARAPGLPPAQMTRHAALFAADRRR
jgi:hypothetical protein